MSHDVLHLEFFEIGALHRDEISSRSYVGKNKVAVGIAIDALFVLWSQRQSA